VPGRFAGRGCALAVIVTMTQSRRSVTLDHHARTLPQSGRAVKAGRRTVMSEHRTSLQWSRNGGPFARGNYVSDHEIRYSGGQTVHAAPSPEYGGSGAHADPEQMLLGACRRAIC
jgi:hypothetical protein